jgi:pimeloyl-ACP methyl ester carboxylesterase
MWTYNHRQWDTPSRRESGLVIVLPGIDGLSWCTRSVARGLAEAGLPYAIEIHDWTYGPLWAIHNLRDSRRHQAHAVILCEKIAEHQSLHPGTPTFLVGHSAGGAMTLLTLEKLEPAARIEAGILLAPAVSPGFDVGPALARTKLGLWNFHAWRDLVFLGILTTVCGTVDGQHGPSAGLRGFRSSPATADPDGPQLHQVPWQWSMTKYRNFAGHFGCVNRVFVKACVAPILRNREPSPVAARA